MIEPICVGVVVDWFQTLNDALSIDSTLIPGTPGNVAPPIAVIASIVFGNGVGYATTTPPFAGIPGASIHCTIIVSIVLPL